MYRFFLAIAIVPAFAQNQAIPTTIHGSVAGTLEMGEGQFLSIAEAMPESKYSFIPTDGNFDGARSFGEQVKHVACSHVAFFNEIEGKAPPAGCETGGPSKAATKAELLQYLRNSFDYGTAYCRRLRIRPRLRVWRVVTEDRIRAWGLQSRRSGTFPITTGNWSSICG